MIRINFTNLNQILTFDGEVLEVFYGTKSARVHIAHVKSLADQAKELAAEVQQASETFKL